MRFGFSAKKIENKISANIIKSYDEEGLKAIISDYESRLKDFENDRTTISEPQRQKQSLKQRLQKANENMLKNVLDVRVEQRKNADNALIHWSGIGIINTCTQVNEIIDTTKIHDGWKVATVEIKRDQDFENIIEHSLNSQLKNAALETKRYAEQVKKENDILKSQLEKANKKIKSIELAKGFEKCNDELLDKWEKIFTN